MNTNSITHRPDHNFLVVGGTSDSVDGAVVTDPARPSTPEPSRQLSSSGSRVTPPRRCQDHAVNAHDETGARRRVDEDSVHPHVACGRDRNGRLCAAGLLPVFRHGSSQRLHSSKACASPAQALSGGTCRFTGQASVIGVSAGNAPSIQVTFSSLPGRRFAGQTAADNQPNASSMVIGAIVTAEIWKGKVTRFDGVQTIDSPETLLTDLFGIAAFVGLLGVFVSGWAALLVRRAFV